MTEVKVKKNSKKEGWAKFLSDFLPLIVFVIIYKNSQDENPILLATFWMIVVTAVSLTASYFMTRRLAKMPLISALLLGIFGSITVFSGNDIFIKIKPTLLNLVFATILLYGYFAKKPLISYLFGGELKLKSQEAWHQLSLRWALFFIFLAFLNEIIWRNFSLDFWVNFKVFGVLPISIIFTIMQVPFIIKNIKK